MTKEPPTPEQRAERSLGRIFQLCQQREAQEAVSRAAREDAKLAKFEPWWTRIETDPDDWPPTSKEKP